MVNLLPAQMHRAARGEYRRRLFSVWFFSLAAVFALGALLLLPAYFFVSVARNEALGEATKAQQSQTTQTATAAAGEQFSAALFGALSQEASYPRPSGAFEAIVAARTPGISLQGMSDSATATTSVIALAGVAATRDALLAFKASLSQVPGVSAVNLPIESLVESTDVTFSMSLSYATPPPSTPQFATSTSATSTTTN